MDGPASTVEPMTEQEDTAPVEPVTEQEETAPAEPITEHADTAPAEPVIDQEDTAPVEPPHGEACLAVETDSRPDDCPEIHPCRVVEAILFAADSPMPASKIAAILGVGTSRDVRTHIEALNGEYAEWGLAFRIEHIAKGYQMLTLPAYNAWLKKLIRTRQETKLSPAAMETLAIVAYKQPCTRADVEAVRGVAAGDLLNRLREMNLAKIVGRAEDLGRPLLYGTTKRFLEVFGLPSLEDLPQVEALGTDEIPAADATGGMDVPAAEAPETEASEEPGEDNETVAALTLVEEDDASEPTDCFEQDESATPVEQDEEEESAGTDTSIEQDETTESTILVEQDNTAVPADLVAPDEGAESFESVSSIEQDGIEASTVGVEQDEDDDPVELADTPEDIEPGSTSDEDESIITPDN